ncbi:hypothetical protein HanIR_Chr07g0310121 [Helianthus annuus]|nr:hypothetical protein HanIR_Chr07g0310121 [Helianthus annuus]
MVGLRMFYHNHHLFQKTSYQSKLSQKPRRRSCVYPWLGGAMQQGQKAQLLTNHFKVNVSNVDGTLFPLQCGPFL